MVRFPLRIPALLILASLLAVSVSPANEVAQSRDRLLREIADDVRRTAQYLGRDRLNPAVLAAMKNVPRHELVPDNQRRYAYENRPLPIGYGQTISQPYIVAIMTELIDPEAGDVVLEVGTGSGYQAAVLAEIVERVCTLEIIPQLAKRAKADLHRIGYSNVRSRKGDGYYGWPECGPFDGIVVTAGASHVPPPLIEQLKPGGKLIIPVGSRFMTQQLLLVEKDEAGELRTRQILPVRFVPLTGGH
ncbi:MAG: protein-L-isoaspartate(D-aspartate) O-methyltransferase [Gammaproteobacteria bacterium]|nr:MAG: protein-L-isoaspartate(D-aspartate) O-methyltransferase [Gammaproteobacteria bacterium]